MRNGVRNDAGPVAFCGIGHWLRHIGATDRGIPIVSILFVAIAVTVMPAHSHQPAPPEQSTLRVAEQRPAPPGTAGNCYVQGKWYPNGATVPLDPGPLSAMAAPLYVRCRQGMLCYDTAPTVCVRPGRLGR
jgi:hypothetical protein